jgi:hypothetical protein
MANRNGLIQREARIAVIKIISLAFIYGCVKRTGRIAVRGFLATCADRIKYVIIGALIRRIDLTFIGGPIEQTSRMTNRSVFTSAVDISEGAGARIICRYFAFVDSWIHNSVRTNGVFLAYAVCAVP